MSAKPQATPGEPAAKLDDPTVASITEATQAADQIDRFLRQFSALATLSSKFRDVASLENILGEKRRRLAQITADESAAQERLATATAAIGAAQDEAAAIVVKATADAGAVVSDAQAQADKIIARQKPRR